MIQKNYQYIAETLAILGLGEVFNKNLKTGMELGLDKIPLKAVMTIDPATNKKVTIEPKIERGESREAPGQKSEMYFFNGYNATLSQEGKQDIKQYFAVFKQNGLAVDKAANLLDGRQVYNPLRKDGEEIGRWARLEFSTQTQSGNYKVLNTYEDKVGFNLVKTLGGMGVITASDEEKEKMLKGLRNGDRVSVMIKDAGRTERMHIEAAPNLGIIRVFNSQGDEVRIANKNNKLQVVASPDSDDMIKKAKEVMEKSQKGNKQQSQGAKVA